ncbi:MAG: iron-containing alcohol dehydrogenase [Rhodospirillaceae bacterium]|nr:iron-containing alcohol dehydrogenase [Rhodospirillaceae bacterium]
MAVIEYLTRIVFDVGAIAQLPDILAELGVKRPLIVTDAGLARSPIVEACRGVLDRRSAPAFYGGVTPNPTESSHDEARALYSAHGCDGVVGLGGGSSIDLAKTVRLMATHPGNLADYKTDGRAAGAISAAMPPMVAIPTTAGTGSEIGRGAGITLRADGQKAVFAHRNLLPSVALCDPALTFSLPPALTAGTGIDAFGHAFEAYLSVGVNPPVDAVAIDAMRRAYAFLEPAVRDGTSAAARWNMMMAAVEGGMCFWKGLGPAHALGIPLDAFDLHHGTLIGVLLPHVARRLADACAEKFGALKSALGLPASADLADALQRWNERIGLPPGLAAMGVPAAALEPCARAAAESFFNRTVPVRLGADDYLRMLEAAYARS